MTQKRTTEKHTLQSFSSSFRPNSKIVRHWPDSICVHGTAVPFLLLVSCLGITLDLTKHASSHNHYYAKQLSINLEIRHYFSIDALKTFVCSFFSLSRLAYFFSLLAPSLKQPLVQLQKIQNGVYRLVVRSSESNPDPPLPMRFTGFHQQTNRPHCFHRLFLSPERVL